MKKTWKWLLMAAVVLGLSMNVTSCKDDNLDNGRTPEEIAQDPYEKESEAADALYCLVSQLSICDSLPNNWKTATFEPKAGKVLDASQPHVRTIAVNNAAEAVVRYNSLTGKDLPATTITDTYKVDGVGTLQLNVGGAGTIATIDVDVKQMPQLAQLRFVSVADMGENGHFKGEPYYRFGDVVRDNDGCYWICVRPAYSPNGKEDTHWMSFQLTDKNIKTYTKKGCQSQKYPVDLGVQKEKMQYLAQLMAILANPDGYKEAAGEGNYFGGTGLGGLQEAAMPVDSLVKQAKLWKMYKVWEKIMPVGYKPEEVQTFKDRFKKNVLFIYEKGSTSGTNLTIRVALYQNANTFYTVDPMCEKLPVDMREIAFDVTNSYSTKGKRTNENNPIPDAFVVRYKSGYQLSSNLLFNPSATDSIPGVTTVHRFSAWKGNDGAEGLVSMADMQLGDLICQWCDVQADELTGSVWRTKTYEVTEGVVTDASIPTERCVQVGTLAEADAYAAHALNGLGISNNNPNGFSFSDAQVGTVSYHHGGSDGNTLATIDVNVKQLPGLTRMLLVKTLPENAGSDPFYRAGDIICYERKGEPRYAVCVSEHTKNQKALFVTMNDQSQHKTGTFDWPGIGQDTVYSDRMASSQALYLWLKNIVLNENKLEAIRKYMTEEYRADEEMINQVVPATEAHRHMLLYNITNVEMLMTDVMEKPDVIRTSDNTLVGVGGSSAVATSKYFWMYKDQEETEMISAPRGMLLTNKLRWSEHTDKNWDHWVPFIYLMPDEGYALDEEILNRMVPLTSLSPSHFKWETLGTVELTKKLNENGLLISSVSPNVYRVFLLATYWQHDFVDIMRIEKKILFNYTKDLRNHPDSYYRNNMQADDPQCLWKCFAITSSEISFTDRGVEKKGYTTIYRDREN